MAVQNTPRGIALDLTCEEQWVLHHVMLDRIELELHAPETTDPALLAVFRVFEKLEADTHWFSERECQCIQNELRQYAAAKNTPERDQPLAERVLAKLQDYDATLPELTSAQQ